MKILPVSRLKFNNIERNSRKVTFKGFECSEDSFEIKRVYNLSCPICGRTMIQQNQIDSFVSACKNAKGDNLINLLSKNRKYFHETEAKVADILSYQAAINPEADMLELSSIYLQKHIKEMKIIQLDAVSGIRRLAGNLSASQKAQIEAIIQKYTYIIEKESEKFSKNDLIQEISKIIPNFHSSRKKISKQIDKVPTVNDDEYKFLKRYGEKSVAELASKLLTPSLSTCEHIKPKSSGGLNNTENYLAQCQECNSTRNDTPFASWIIGKNGVADNLIKYIKLVAGKIESGEISSDYADYPSDIAKTIAEESNGRIKPEAPSIEFTQDAVKINFEAKIARLKKSIADSKAELEKEQKLHVKSKNSRQFKLYLEYVELEKEKNSLMAQKQALLQDQKKLNGLINNYYSTVIELRELQNQALKVTTPKESEKLRKKIVSQQRYISLTRIEEKEQERDEVNAQIARVGLRLNNIDYKLQTLKPKINFSSQYQAMINDLKVEIFELTGLLEKTSKRKEYKAEIHQLNSLAKEKEARIRELTDENATLNPNDENGNNIDEYKIIKQIIPRADELREKMQKTSGKEPLEVDTRIFEYAKQSALEKMEKLKSQSSAVKRYINLEEIENSSAELKQIYSKIEQLNIKLAELEEIQKTIDSKKSMAELNYELGVLNIKLQGAKEVEASVDVEQRIQSLEDEIERKTAILEKIENKEISEEDFIKAFSEI